MGIIAGCIVSFFAGWGFMDVMIRYTRFDDSIKFIFLWIFSFSLAVVMGRN